MKLTQVRKLALALPEVTEEPHFDRTSFRIRGKIIATAIADEPFLNIMASEPVREPALAMYPDALEKLYWGKKVCGVRVHLENAESEMVAELLEKTWKEKAPKSLVND
ncbi:MAG: MmcQ/YjbR family DNA-binding protein [Pseudomonadales bacterium]|nr:MmcQ/YjbR family DNA-binding protein [Pseudomonadales bacterium]